MFKVFKVLTRLAMSLAAGALLLPMTAEAQSVSPGRKFLEAVRKKDGEKVTESLNTPGPTLVNTRDGGNGETALHIVTARRDLTWMNFLIAKGANVNAHDSRGITPLVLASNLGFVEGVELLVSKKASVDEVSSTGETPLIAAVHRRDLEMMRILLKAGADPNRADNSGRSALDYARIEGGALLAAIESSVKTRAAASSSATYGPKL